MGAGSPDSSDSHRVGPGPSGSSGHWRFIPAQLLDVLYSAPNEQADRPFEDVCTFDGWPDLPIHAVASRDDRFFPVEFEQRLARDRLGLDVDVVPGGHLSALSHPDELAEVLAGYLAAAQIS